MKRRDFFKLLPAVASIPLLSRVAAAMRPPMLTLVGDGIADDTEALQAFCDGKDVWNAAGHFQINGREIFGGHFRFSKTIDLNAEVQFSNSKLEWCGEVAWDGSDIPLFRSNEHTAARFYSTDLITRPIILWGGA